MEEDSCHSFPQKLSRTVSAGFPLHNRGKTDHAERRDAECTWLKVAIRVELL